MSYIIAGLEGREKELERLEGPYIEKEKVRSNIKNAFIDIIESIEIEAEKFRSNIEHACIDLIESIEIATWLAERENVSVDFFKIKRLNDLLKNVHKLLK